MSDRKKLFEVCTGVMGLSVELGKVIEKNNLQPEDKEDLERVLDAMTSLVYDDFNELKEEFSQGRL